MKLIIETRKKEDRFWKKKLVQTKRGKKETGENKKFENYQIRILHLCNWKNRELYFIKLSVQRLHDEIETR